MVFTIEPMVNAGTWEDVTWDFDEWTSATKDGKRSAQFEHTVVVTETGCEILTARTRASPPLFLEAPTEGQSTSTADVKDAKEGDAKETEKKSEHSADDVKESKESKAKKKREKEKKKKAEAKKKEAEASSTSASTATPKL